MNVEKLFDGAAAVASDAEVGTPTPPGGDEGQTRTWRPEARQTPRAAVRWSGRYRLDSEPDYGWRACTVLDVSRGGAGLELLDAVHKPAETLLTCRLTMEIELYEGDEPVFGWFTRGSVVNVTSGSGPGLRVGVKFEDMTELEQDVLDAVVQIRSGRSVEVGVFVIVDDVVA